jgi:hypothetical protein
MREKKITRAVDQAIEKLEDRKIGGSRSCRKNGTLNNENGIIPAAS